MSSATTIFDRLPASQFGRQLAAALAASLWRHRFLHAMAISALLLAAIVGAKTGNMLDFGAIKEFGGYLFIAFALVSCALAVIRFVWLAFVEKNPAPLGAFLRSFTRFFGDVQRIANGVNGMAAVVAFCTAFGVLKGAIAILSPFTWDRTLSHMDRLLAFGHYPYEWLWWLVDSHLAVTVFNFAYNFWFFLLLATVFAAVFARRDTALRHQFLAAFMLVWTLGGFFVAMGFSSAGPCYFERLGLGGDYKPLMDALAAVAHDYPVWALATQDMLWRGYIDPSSGSAGISAFPSMHVASAMLFALYWTRRSAVAGAVLWAFAGTIFIGSIVLGWHYAVDGIGSALIVFPLWKAAGYGFGRFAEES